MDKRFQKILEDLKSSSYRQVYHTLVELRTLLQTHRPTTTAQKMRRNGITKLLVRFLRKKYEKLIYLTLSILGTCCLELETRIMLQHEELPRLLMNVQQEVTSDHVQSRICRCISNLASLPAAASDFHEGGVVPILVNIIKSTEENQSSSETKQMAVRALRLDILIEILRLCFNAVCSNRELGDTGEHRKDLLKDDVVKVIADQLSSSDEEIVKASLKTLVSYCSSLEGAVQVQRGCSGGGFEQLVSLAKSGPKPDMALLCICNIAHVASCRPDLGKAGAITVIFEELKKTNYKSEPRTLITALCLFCSEIVNRVRMRDNNHLPDLLELYRSSRYSYLQDIVLVGLTKYLYDDISLKLLIEHGLVSTITLKLQQHIHSLYPTHHDNNAPSAAAASQILNRRFSFDSESELEKSPSWQMSVSPMHSSPPQSPVSVAGPSSPNSSCCMSSPPLSPQSLLPTSCWSPAYSTCSGQTETYSPVYDSSDDDICDELLDSSKSRIDIPKEEEDRHSYKVNLFILLQRIANHDWAIQELMNVKTVKTLLAYIITGRLYISKAAIVLYRIMSRTQFLLPLVHQRYAILVFTKLSLRRHETECNACSVHEKIGNCLLDKAAAIAEGPYGEGELAYLLQRGTQQEITSTVLSIPFIVRTCWLLKKLLITHKGLPLLLSLVTEPQQSSPAVLALFCLAKSLRIDYNPCNSSDELFPDYQPRDVETSTKVTFLLDDGSHVQADRTALGEASDVFNSMLHGAFRESKENLVKIQDISKQTLILLLFFCNSYVDTNELSVGIPDVVHVLDLFIVSDKFLISDLNSKLLCYIKHHYFTVEQFVKLYKWCSSKLDGMVPEIVTLYEDACAYLLTGPIKHKARMQLFNALIENGLWQEIKSSLTTSLTHRMEQGDYE